MSDKTELTYEERALVRRIGNWCNDFCTLPQTHPADAPDVIYHVHALQRIVLTRLAQRAHPEQFPNRLLPPLAPGALDHTVIPGR